MSLKTLFGGRGTSASTPPPGTVRGYFQIAAAALASSEARRSAGWWTGVLTGPGVTPAALMYEEGLVRTDKWPVAGEVVPVTIPVSAPTRFKIVWAEVPIRQEIGLQRARELLAALEKM
jgi:hypothetical protein